MPGPDFLGRYFKAVSIIRTQPIESASNALSELLELCLCDIDAIRERSRQFFRETFPELNVTFGDEEYDSSPVADSATVA